VQLAHLVEFFRSLLRGGNDRFLLPAPTTLPFVRLIVNPTFGPPFLDSLVEESHRPPGLCQLSLSTV